MSQLNGMPRNKNTAAAEELMIHNWRTLFSSQVMRTTAKLILLRIFPLLYFWSPCRAALVNRTIDDSFGDSVTGFKPAYNPLHGRWEDQTCTSCDIQPDPSLAYNGTWTAATYNPQQIQNMSITLQFTGVAIWVFFILSNANNHGSSITTNTNCNFTLDGSHVGAFVHNPDMSTRDLIYNANAFSATGLSNAPHQLIVMTNDVPFKVFVNFDYAIYTAVIADPSSSTSSSSNISDVSHNSGSSQGNSLSVPAIVGAVLGALAVIIIASLLFLLLRIRKSKKMSTSIMPAPLGSPSMSMTQLYSDDNETNFHLPSQSTDFSEPIEPFRNLPAATNSGSFSYSRSALVSTSDYTATIPLLPMRASGHTRFSSHTDNRDKLRAIRQMEIDEQLRSAQREMENLTARPPNAGERLTEANQEMEDLREQVHLLRGQIDHLQRERQSDWALGLSNEPPPAYAG